jgi:flavin reductase (DIM6/NTAB) family NADH-FMN oxidoreductase RutF
VEYAASELSVEAAYKLLIGCVVPRPIAWISTLSEKGRVNLAPFSAFTFISSKPPMIAVSIGPRRSGWKDTAKNIMRDKEFVVNIADLPLIEAVHRSSFAFPEEASEVEALNLATVPSRKVRPPRLEAAPVGLECRLHDAIEFGEDRVQLIVGEVLHFNIRATLCKDGKIDSAKLNPIARLGGPNYAKLGDMIIFGPAGTMPPSANEPGSPSDEKADAR